MDFKLDSSRSVIFQIQLEKGKGQKENAVVQRAFTPHWHNLIYLDGKDHLAESVAAFPTAV